MAHVWLDRHTREQLAKYQRQMVIFAFDHIGNAINLGGVYEGADLDAFFDFLRAANIDTKSKNAVDLGANIGNHSLYFSDHFAKVYSFEPNPRTFKVLSLNAELADNVTCFNAGVSDSNRTAALATSADNIGGAFITEASDKTRPIELRTLDSFGEIQNIGLIKIDVEKHEFQAITGAKNLIQKNQPLILFEQHRSDFINGKSPVIGLLQELGYAHFATLKKYPRVTGGKLKAALLRTLFGESLQIHIENEIEPGSYSFIIALPNWFTIREITG